MKCPDNLPGALAFEIRRVATKRENWAQAARALPSGGASLAISLGMMDKSLDEAVEAVASGDIFTIMRALQDLRGFSD